MEIKGFVERHNESGVSGWCVYADENMRSKPVTLQLYLDDLLLREAYTNRPREDIKRGFGVDDAGFLFSLRPELIELIPAGSVLSVRTTEGVTVPELAPTNVSPIGRDQESGRLLRERLSQGWHIDQWGKLKISFGADPKRKERYIESMSRVCAFFNQRYGLPIFPAYGTLLGYERDRSLIDHDDDVDTAYISRHHTIEEVSAEFWAIMRDLRKLGHSVDIVATGQCNVSLKDSNLPGVDIFSAWLSNDNMFYCYPRIGEKAPDQLLFEEIELEGAKFVVPQPSERFVEMMYGKNWREPDPRYQSVVPQKVRNTMDALKALSEPV